MIKHLRQWQLSGFLFTSAAGTLLHFLYDWSGQFLPAALFSAVNESIWEHMKLLFFPMFLFSLVQYRFVGKSLGNFWSAKAAGIGFGLILIPIFYYSYTGIFGLSCSWINVGIFFVAAAAAYASETTLLIRSRACSARSAFPLLLLLLLALLFVLLTFFPPHIPLFQDPVTGLYGLI